MMWLRRRLQFDSVRDERGMAMAIALIFGMVIVAFVATSLSVATSGLQRANNDQNWNGALSAAYAGINDYQARLSNDNTYFQYGNPNAPFSSGSPVALPTGTATNPAFGIGTSGTWATVPVATPNAPTGYFRYEVDTTQYASTGAIRVRSTGRVGTSVRSVVASIRQQGFINFLYFTDEEIEDPQISGDTSASCLLYAYNGRPTSGCGEIAFGGGDTIQGPAHSNDTMRICDATFTQTPTSAYQPAAGKLRYTATDSNNNACTGQNFPAGVTQPAFSSTIGMPSTNSQQQQETRSDLPTTVPRPGCLYTGPTDIVFNSDGTITVKSPYTKFTNTATATASSGTNPAQCGQPGTSSGQLGSTNGATFTVPANNLIYVQNVPSSSTDVNYTSTTALPVTCTNNHVGYPLSGETVPSLGSAPCAYGSRNGDAFVKGNVHGQVTIAAQNYLYVTGDLKYVDSSKDMLGLTATNAVWVWNPVKYGTYTGTCSILGISYPCSQTGYSAMLSDSGREIDAAIISAAHTFQVQNFDRGGQRGTLTVKGAIAQKFRGIVSSGSNGYVKNYVYDARLEYTAPPKFLSPVTTTYGVTTIGEVKAAFNADGSTHS
jgi:Tfp pilus assembly protein PilX